MCVSRKGGGPGHQLSPPFIAHKRLKNLCTVLIRDHENTLKRFQESGYLPGFNLKTSHLTKLLQREKPDDFFSLCIIISMTLLCVRIYLFISNFSDASEATQPFGTHNHLFTIRGVRLYLDCVRDVPARLPSGDFWSDFSQLVRRTSVL